MSLLSLPPFANLSPARQKALYSDFSAQRTTNPPGFKANVAWWSSLLLLASDRGALPSTSTDDPVGAEGGLSLEVGEDLLESLRVPGGGRPLALGTVIDELISQSTLVPVASYLSPSSSSTASLPLRVASTLLVTPLVWSFRQLGLSGGAESSEKILERVKGSYVVKPNLEKVVTSTTSKIQALQHAQLSETVYTPLSFKSTFAPSLTALETSVLLSVLERKRVLARSSDGEVIRLEFGGTDGKEGRDVGEIERGLLDIKVTLGMLEGQVESLQSKIAERTTQAQQALAKSQKTQALSYLRSKKDLEQVLAKRTSSLGMLQGVLLKMDSSAGDVAILKAYETSTSTLKSLLSLPELQLSSVESTVSNLQDALADQADIDEAVRLSPSSLGEEQELEDELEGMVTREKEAKERERETKLLEARVPEREQTAEKPQEERVRMAESTKEGEKEKERVALPA